MFEKFDKMTFFLWIFILFNIILFVYLINVNKHIDKHTTYRNSLNKLELIDKTFDNFLIAQPTFINYDHINKDILVFDKNLKILSIPYENISNTSEYKKLFFNIAKNYNIKLNNIENFKSQNSQLLHSMHYLFELNLAISKSSITDKKYIYLANETFLYLTKYYIDTSVNKEKILNNIKLLKKSLNTNYTLDMEMFTNHAEINLERIVNFNKIKKFQASGTLYKTLQELKTFIENNYEKNILIEKVVVVLFFIFSIIILYILVVVNKKALRMRDELLGFKTAIENSYNSIVMTDANSNIIYVNEVAQKETGYKKEELIGQNPRILKSGINNQEFYKKLHDSLKNGKKWEGEFVNKRKDGSLYYEKASVMPVYQNGKIVSYLAIKLNITDYIEAKRELEHMAYHDPLTSLPNRANIEHYLQNRLIVAKRQKTKMAVLFIDVDRFKNINDTLGHDVGDELLLEVSKHIKETLRESDMLSRFGGDEFVAVVEDFNDEFAVAFICEKILDIFKVPIKTKKHQLNITLSIGVCIFPSDAQDSTTLFKYADVAMYKAKDDGKNNFKFYKKELSVAVHDRLDMEQALKVAMQKKEFYIMYQPQYLLSDNSVVGIEALVRWKSDSLGNVAPNRFIPVCEEIGYILELGLYIFKQACIDFLIFKKECSTLKTVSINISAVQLYQNDFVDDIIFITQEVGIDKKSIILEITESHIMKSIDRSMKVLNCLKDKGFSISIDDFGTGYSSLSYLKQFPINELKIDKSFIDNLPHDKDDVAITKSILALSSSMGYLNVAEGIETKVQEDFLRDYKDIIAQGYLFCRPQRKDDLISFLLKNIFQDSTDKN